MINDALNDGRKDGASATSTANYASLSDLLIIRSKATPPYARSAPAPLPLHRSPSALTAYLAACVKKQVKKSSFDRPSHNSVMRRMINAFSRHDARHRLQSV